MQRYPIYQADAFTQNLFGGNPAAVVPLADWLPHELMQQIAAENNLSETAFVIVHPDQVQIRWFTPGTEVDLCGHATLAAAHILVTELGWRGTTIPFFSHRSGALPVTVLNNGYQLNFPADVLTEISVETHAQLINLPVVKAFTGKTDLIFLLENEEAIRKVLVDLKALAALPYRGLIVTAAGSEAHVVSRFFGPACGVDEDPVTGSAHTSLAVLWSPILKKKSFSALQLSSREGRIEVEINEEGRILLTGNAVTYMKGEIFV